MFIRLLRDHEGRRRGDDVRIEDAAEGTALVDSGCAVEIRRRDGKWEEVARHSVEVVDSVVTR